MLKVSVARLSQHKTFYPYRDALQDSFTTGNKILWDPYSPFFWIFVF